jgi:hypothetical protein
VLGSLSLAPAVLAQGPEGIRPTPEEPPTRQGTRGSNFLHIAVGARANAMAGAVGSSVAGPSAWYWNAAGAVTSEGFAVAAGRQNLYGDLGLHQTYAAASLPLLGGVVGLSFNTVNSGDMDRTSEAAPLGDVAAGRTFQWTSTAVSLGYARRLTDRLAVGFAGKYITEGITDLNADWVALDIGTQFNTGIYGLVLGGALQHVGGSSRADGPLLTQTINNPELNRQITRGEFATRKLELPTTFRFSAGNALFGSAESLFGGAGGPHALTAEVAVADAVDLATQLSLAAEYSFRRVLFVRGGKRFFNDDRDPNGRATFGLSGGFGLRLPVASRDFRFDYSYTNLGELQNIQVFSFEFGR